MKTTLSKKMIVYFLAVIVAAAGGFAVTLFKCNDAEGHVAVLAQREIPRMEKTAEIAYNAMAKTANIRAYYIYGNEQYYSEYKRVADLNEKLETELLADVQGAEEKKLLSELKQLDEEYAAIAEKKVGESIRIGKKEEAMQFLVNELAPKAKVLLSKVDEVKVLQRQIISQNANEAVASTQSAQRAAIGATVLVVIIGLVLAVTAARRITGPLKELQVLMAEASKGNLRVEAKIRTSDEIGELASSFNTMIQAQKHIIHDVKNGSAELTTASEEMSASAEEVSTASGDIAKEVQRVAQAMVDASKSNMETAQVLIELSSLIQIAKDKAQSAGEHSAVTMAAARNGKTTIAEAIESMNTIYDKTVEAEKVISLLNEYSQQVGMINETITGIARQTNLLALNAAIEAARAGEAGRGFAVVAEEVRNLAEQSDKEASSISQLVGKIQGNTNNAVVAMKHSLTEVESGVQAVGKAEKSLENILSAVTETVEAIDGIAKVTNDEVATSDKIVQLIETVSEDIETTEKEAQAVAAATEEVNATVETIAASSEQTSAMAQKLQRDIVSFQI